MEKQLLYAYLAGAIDADGWITIYRSNRKAGKRYSHNPTYYLAKFGFTGTDPTVHALLKDEFGGSFYSYDRHPNKMVYVWETSNAKAEVALTALLPHFRMKRRQAELALCLITMTREQWIEIKHTQKPPYHITPEMEEQRESLWKQMVILNGSRNRKPDIA